MTLKSMPAATAIAVVLCSIGQSFAGGHAVECYARYHQPAIYGSERESVPFRSARSREEVVPAIYGTRRVRTLMSPGYVRERVIPAEYRTSRERVLIYPETTVTRKIPAVTDTVYRKVRVEAGYAWEYRRIHGRMVLCKVKRKASYRIVSETVVVRPARLVRERVAASYGYSERSVLVRPEQREQVIVGAEYGYEVQRVLIQPEQRQVFDIPAEYQVVDRQVLVRESRSGWERVAIPRHCRG